MDKHLIGILFITVGLGYGSMAFDTVYDHTLGWLLENGWIKIPTPPKEGEKSLLGRKETIYFYSILFILTGIFILIKL